MYFDIPHVRYNGGGLERIPGTFTQFSFCLSLRGDEMMMNNSAVGLHHKPINGVNIGTKQ